MRLSKIKMEKDMTNLHGVEDTVDAKELEGLEVGNVLAAKVQKKKKNENFHDSDL